MWARAPRLQDRKNFLSSLRPEDAAALEEIGRRRRFRARTTLFLEGDSSDHVVVLLKGRVKISYVTEDGSEILLAVREDGDLLGELSVIDGRARSASAQTLEPSEGLVVGAEAFRAFLASHPSAAVGLLEMVVMRLRDSDRKRIEFGAFDTVGRVAGRLVEMCERFGEADARGVSVSLSLTQEDLAAWVGASRKAVTVALADLRARGLIETGRKKVIVRDLEALRRRVR